MSIMLIFEVDCVYLCPASCPHTVSMHPRRGIVGTDRRSDSISLVPDDPNTLTRQCNGTNDAPRDPRSSAPLHRTLPGHGPDLRYIYIYRLPSQHHHRRRARRNHSATAPRVCQLTRQVSDSGDVIVIGSYSLATVSGST